MPTTETGITTLIIGAVAAISAGITKYCFPTKTEMTTAIDKVDKKLEKSLVEREGLKSEYLTEAKHTLICDARISNFKNHMTKEIQELKDETFTEMRATKDELLKEIRNGR